MDKVDNIMGGTNEVAEGFERIYQAVMALPDIEYEVSGDYRRVIILDECYCSTRMEMEGILCAVCLADSRRRHGDAIPYMEGEL